MKSYRFFTCLAVVLMLFISQVYVVLGDPLLGTGESIVHPRGVVEDQYMAQYADGSWRALPIAELRATDGLRLADGFNPMEAAMANALSEPEIVYVEPIYYLELEEAPNYTPNDLLSVDRWRFDTTGLKSLWGEFQPKYGNLVGTENEVVVAVIDDGISAGMRDLNVSAGYDFADNDADPSPVGTHGNHVAGIIGANMANSYSTLGVYPNVRLMPLKVFSNTGGGTTADLVEAIDYARQQGVDVINMSLSYPSYTAAVKTAIDAAAADGIIIVVATGNDASLWPLASGNEERPSGDQEFTSMAFPALHEGVIAVGAAQYTSGNAIAISDYSNGKGSYVVSSVTYTKDVDIIAPGSNITSSYYRSSDPADNTTIKSGTSMATPHVAGLMALLRAQYPTLDKALLLDALKNTADTNVLVPTFTPSIDAEDMIGAGYMQTQAALSYYLPETVTLEGQDGMTTEAIPFSFNPLDRTLQVALDKDYSAIRLTINGARISSSTVQGSPTSAGQSGWLDTSTLPATFTFTTTAAVGHTETYTLQVTRNNPSNGQLSHLFFPESGKTIAAGDLAGTYYVPHNATSLYVFAQPKSESSTVLINGLATSERRIDLVSGNQVIAIQVTSSDTSDVQNYSLTVHRLAEAAPENMVLHFKDASNGLISSSSFGSGDLTPVSAGVKSAFLIHPNAATQFSLASSQTNFILPYTLYLESSSSSTAVLTPIPFGGSGVNSALTLPRSSASFRYGFSTSYERVTLTLDSDSLINLNPSALTLTSGSLSPAFNPTTTSYSASVDNAVSTLTVTSAVSDPRAQLAIDGTAQGSKAVALNVGDNVVTLVLRPDATTYPASGDSKTITLTITRSPAATTTTAAATTTTTTTAATTTSTSISTTTTAPPTTSAPSTTASGGGGVIIPPPPGPIPGPVPAPVPTTTVPPTTSNEGFESTTEVNADGQQVDLLSPNIEGIEAVIADLPPDSTEPLIIDLSDYTATEGSSGTAVSLSPEMVGALRAADRPVRLQLPNLQIELPTGLLVTSNPIAIRAIQGEPSAGNLAPPIQFSLQEGSRQISQFIAPIAITLSFNPSDLSGLGIRSVSQLAVYYWDDELKDWTYAGGRITGSGQITFQTKHFSQFAIRAYAPEFTDIDGHWAKNEIQSIANKRIAQGIGDDLFSPNTALTNAQMITFITRTLNLPGTTVKAPYSDISQASWYSLYLNRAYSKGLLSTVYGGTARDTLEPSTSISREQMAGLLVNAYSYFKGIPKAELLYTTEVKYVDEATISQQFRADVAIATQLKLMGGTSSNRFEPKRGATRAEAMAVLQRLLNQLGK